MTAEELLAAISMLKDRSAEFNALTKTLSSLESTLADLLARVEHQETPDMTGPLCEAMQRVPAAQITVAGPDMGPLLAWLQALQLPAPQVHLAPNITTAAPLPTPPGTQWAFDFKKTAQGLSGTITKL